MPYYVQTPPNAPQKPSSGYKALGIVMLCLGIAGVLWAFVSLGSLALVGSLARRSTAIYGSETFVFGAVRGVMSIVTGAMVAAAGFGVFRGKKWSRMLGLAYAGLSLFDTLVGAAVNILIIQPKAFSRLGSMGHRMELFTYVSAGFTVLVASALPIIVIVAMLRSGAKQELDA